MKSLKVIISGGGTGGHIFPAIAIADELKRRLPEVEILFVGAEGRMEMEKVPQAGYQIEGLKIAGLQRSLSLKNLSFPFKVVNSLLKAGKIIARFRPDIAIGVGGYASGPLLYMAQRKGVKTLIQEQNSFPGITNKLLSKGVTRICVAYDGLAQFFPKDKISLTGNPVRAAILNTAQHDKNEVLSFFKLKADKPVLLVVGGSLGARSINQALLKDWPLLQDAGIQVLWQTGKTFYEAHENELSKLPEGITVTPFIKEMDRAYAAANVVVSRAGALAITELCIVAKPIILVPSPFVSEDHQRKNAMALVNKHAALMVQEHETANELIPAAVKLMGDNVLQQNLATNISALAKPKATEDIVNEVLKLIA